MNRTVYIFFILTVLFITDNVLAQRTPPKAVAVIEGDTLFKLLEPDAIPAIRKPVYVSNSEASAQMSADEPVIGIMINGEQRAYSLWQLDHHEIVNDYFGDTPVAVTW